MPERALLDLGAELTPTRRRELAPDLEALITSLRRDAAPSAPHHERAEALLPALTTLHALPQDERAWQEAFSQAVERAERPDERLALKAIWLGHVRANARDADALRSQLIAWRKRAGEPTATLTCVQGAMLETLAHLGAADVIQADAAIAEAASCQATLRAGEQLDLEVLEAIAHEARYGALGAPRSEAFAATLQALEARERLEQPGVAACPGLLALERDLSELLSPMWRDLAERIVSGEEQEAAQAKAQRGLGLSARSARRYAEELGLKIKRDLEGGRTSEALEQLEGVIGFARQARARHLAARAQLATELLKALPAEADPASAPPP